MSGILFLRTQNLDRLKEFYSKRIGADIWLEQADCAILRHGNFLFGFCDRDETQSDAMLTFFYETREEVDRIYSDLKDIATTEPIYNEKYDIYQFFATDPDGRMVEIQQFNRHVAAFRDGEDLLLSRRSVRKYEDREVPTELLDQVLELSRFAPTARNSQPYYFKFIRDRETIEWLSETRGRSSGPIARAPMAVAICSDPAVSNRHVQDGCIGAYHFILAAWFHGLGTCWIAAMDTDEIKTRLDIPQDHYVVTVTPLGYPAGPPKTAPERKPAADYVKDDWR